ncbi:hypothetical protein AB7M47_000305 [Bradyrhizobium elkanii]
MKLKRGSFAANFLRALRSLSLNKSFWRKSESNAQSLADRHCDRFYVSER